MKLTIYTDASFREVREVREVPRMKIPYRTAEAVVEVLSDVDFTDPDGNAILRVVLRNYKQITAVVQATFGLVDEELHLIDTMELGALAKEIVAYVVGKMTELGLGGEGTDPNATKPAATT